MDASPGIVGPGASSAAEGRLNRARSDGHRMHWTFCVPLLICVSMGCFASDNQGNRAGAIQEFREFFKDSMPYDAETEAEWGRLAHKLASMGPDIAVDLMALEREVVMSTTDELAHVSMAYFSEPIWLLPKDRLREAGLLLVEMPDDYLPEQETRINGLHALALVHDERDLGVVKQSLRSNHIRVRAFATYCLGFWPDRLVHDEVVKAIRSREYDTRFKGCLAAFNVGAAAFEDEFRALLAAKETPLGIRRVAQEALASLGDREAQQALLGMATKTKDPFSQALAVDCLLRLELYDDWWEVARLLRDADEVFLTPAVLQYLLGCPDERAKRMAQDRIVGDKATRARLDDYGATRFQKLEREDGGGYLLLLPRP